MHFYLPLDQLISVEGSEQLQQFVFVFLIPLRNVNEKSLAETVKDQLGLDEESTEYIEIVLNGKNKSKTLIILDGYDEYTKGTNKDIDNLIKSPANNCFFF